MLDLPWTIYANAIVYCCIFSLIFPFEYTGVDLLVDLYGLEEAAAGRLLSFIPIICLLSPVVGRLGNTFRRQQIACVVGLGVIMMAFFGLALDIVPISLMPIVLLLIGFGYTVSVVAVNSVVPNYVGSAQLETTALGMMFLVMSVGMFFANLAVGWIHDASGSYRLVCVFFVVLAIVGVVTALALLLYGQPARHFETEGSIWTRSGVIPSMGLGTLVSLLELETVVDEVEGARDYDRYEDLHRDYARQLEGSGGPPNQGLLRRSKSLPDVHCADVLASDLAVPGGFRRQFVRRASKDFESPERSPVGSRRTSLSSSYVPAGPFAAVDKPANVPDLALEIQASPRDDSSS